MATRIESVREWAEVDQRDHLVALRLGDETNSADGSNYEFIMTPDEALNLAEKLVEIAASVDLKYEDPYRSTPGLNSDSVKCASCDQPAAPLSFWCEDCE